MAYDGSAPAACSATVSSEVVVVLPWVPATATHAWPGHHRRPGRPSGAAPAARGAGPRRTRGCPRGRRWRRPAVSAPATWAASWPRWHGGAELAQCLRGSASPWPSLPLTGDAAGEHDPGDAGQAGAADADEVDAAELVGREQLVGDGDPHRAPDRRQRSIRASSSSASRGIRRRGRGTHRGQPVGSWRRAGTVARDPLGGERGVGDQQRRRRRRRPGGR